MKRNEKFGPRFAIPSYVVSVRGEHGSMLTSNPELIAAQAECYLSSRPGGAVDVEYYEQCGYCRGSGRKLTNRRTLTWKPCKACNGEPIVCPEMRIKTFVGQTWSDRAH